LSFLLTYSDEFLKYSLGPNHPMRPDRIVAAMSLMDYHLRDNDDFKIIGPNPVDPSTLTLAHTEEYITLMKKLSVPDSNSYEDIEKGLFFYGLGTSDCPVFDHMAEVSDLIVGSTLTAAQSILNNEFSNAFVLLAGLHHASRERASGFCYYNDINVTIRKLQQENPKIKILYLDTDLHAGDGVNYEFYNDPNVLTISFHESGKYLYPGTCFSDEIGSGDGEGYAINLPLYPNTYDSIYQKSIERYLPSFVESFKPDIILWQAGVDGHAMDPLGHLQLTTNTYDKLGTLVRKLSQHMEQPRVLAMGGGGYNPNSVARSWFVEVASLANVQIPDKTPKSWIERCKTEFNLDMPINLRDPKIELSNYSVEIINNEHDKLTEYFEKCLSPYWSL